MCPRFLFVDTNNSVHKGHHPHSHTWSTHGRNRTLTKRLVFFIISGGFPNGGNLPSVPGFPCIHCESSLELENILTRSFSTLYSCRRENELPQTRPDDP